LFSQRSEEKQPNLKMKLLVAISVLVLVLAAHSDAQESEPTLEERFTQFQQQMQTLTEDMVEKSKTAFEQFHTSEFAVKSKNFFTEQFEKLKQKVHETFSSQS
ncbi:hypothetical protein DKP78_14770, partial [Enterococcus faecium]